MIGILLLHDDNCETADVPHEIPLENIEAISDGDQIEFNGNLYKITRRSPRLNKTGGAGNFYGKFTLQPVFEAEIIPQALDDQIPPTDPPAPADA